MPELTMAPPVVTASAAPVARPAAAPTPVSGSSSRNSAPPSAPAPAPAGKTVDVPINQDKLGEWAKLNRTIRETSSKLTATAAEKAELERKVTELEALRDPAGKFSEVTKLLGEGKALAAMKAAGVKLDEAFAQWVDDNENNPAPAAPPAELVELKAKYDELAARAAREDEAKANADKEAQAAAQKAQRDGMVKELTDKIAGDSGRWARCGKEPAEAANDAIGIATEKARTVMSERAKAQGFDSDLSKLTAEQRALVALNDEEATELFDLALDAAEEGYRALAEKFHIPAPKPTATVRRIEDYFRDRKAAPAAPTRDGSPVAERKVAVTLDGQRGSLRTPKEIETKGKLSAADARTKAIASAARLSRS